MDFLSANGIWLLLGLVVIWMLMSRGGLGCGFGRPRSSRSGDTKDVAADGESPHDHGAVNGTERSAPRSRDSAGLAHSRRRGC